MPNLLHRALGHLVSCKDTSRLVSRMQDGPLTGWEQARLRWHLAVCGMCRTFEQQMRVLREAVRRYRD